MLAHMQRYLVLFFTILVREEKIDGNILYALIAWRRMNRKRMKMLAYSS